jgi:Fe-Mn family superoxide dismutase
MFALPDLPYAYDALQPVISAETMRFHHDKHHAAYVKTVNELLADRSGHAEPLEGVILSASKAGEKKLFNNAAQAWNHAFLWSSMSATREIPSATLESAIASAFGGQDALKAAFVKEGVGHFGSGWVWLTADAGGALKLVSTHDAGCPVTEPGVTAVLVCDLWEHAYYIDYRNDRKGYLEAWFDALPNWAFASQQLANAGSAGKSWCYPAAGNA